MSDNERFADPTEIRHVIGAAGTFSLHNVSGDVEIRGVDTDEVRVVASSSHGSSDTLPLIVRRGEGSLDIRIENMGPAPNHGRGSKSVDFEIELPRGANVQMNGISSDIEAAGLTGDQSFKSVSGDIQIEGHGGRVSLVTVSGDVDLTADPPVSADSATTSGDVEINAPLLNALHVKSVSGDTQIKAAFAAGQPHAVESVSGDLSVESLSGLTLEIKRGMDVATGRRRQLVFGDGSAQLSFRTLSGDADLDASTETTGRTATAQPMPGMPPMPPIPAMPQMPPMPPMPAAPAEQTDPAEDSLEILQALERGEIDVDEATRRLEGATNRG